MAQCLRAEAADLDVVLHRSGSGRSPGWASGSKNCRW